MNDKDFDDEIYDTLMSSVEEFCRIQKLPIDTVLRPDAFKTVFSAFEMFDNHVGGCLLLVEETE